jgi:hypothetical protein
MGAIERFCDRAMLLEKGRMVMVGDPGEVARSYNALNFGTTVHERAESGQGAEADGPAVIVDGWFEDRTGGRVAAVADDEPLRACMEVRFNERVQDPIFGFTLRNEVGSTVFATATDHQQTDTGSFGPDQTVIVRLAFENWLTPSRYNLTPSVAHHGTGAHALDLREDIASVLVHGGRFTGGVVNLPHSFEISRDGH